MPALQRVATSSASSRLVSGLRSALASAPATAEAARNERLNSAAARIFMMLTTCWKAMSKWSMRPPWFVAHRRLPESLAGMERRLRVRRRPAAIRAARIVASSSRSTIMRVTVIGGGHGCYAAPRTCTKKATRCAGGGATPRPAPRWQGRQAGGHRLSRHRRIAIGDGPGQLRLARELRDAVQDAEADRHSAARHHARRAGGSRRCWRTGGWCSCRPAPSAASCSRAPSARPQRRAQVAYAETGTLPYLAQARPPARGHQRLRHAPAHRRLPLRLADAALRRLAQAYPSVEPAGDGLSGARS